MDTNFLRNQGLRVPDKTKSMYYEDCEESCKHVALRMLGKKLFAIDCRQCTGKHFEGNIWKCGDNSIQIKCSNSSDFKKVEDFFVEVSTLEEAWSIFKYYLINGSGSGAGIPSNEDVAHLFPKIECRI
jgi:hypothetical protein